MGGIWHQIWNRFFGTRARRRAGPMASPSRATDWLPPVLGPEDWSIGLMCDRGADWYLDRR